MTIKRLSPAAARSEQVLATTGTQEATGTDNKKEPKELGPDTFIEKLLGDQEPHFAEIVRGLDFF